MFNYKHIQTEINNKLDENLDYTMFNYKLATPIT